MSDKKPDLSAAYALNTPDDSVQLYADWADTYDSTFAEATGYRLPAAVAEHFVTLSGQGPVLDVGAGTGLVGAALSALGIGPVDATDISPDMLTVAESKGHYRQLVVGNILKKLDLSDGSYAGLISAGTFTSGHVGPDGLDEILRLGASGALVAITINGAHFKAQGFEDKFNALEPRIADVRFDDVRIYQAGSEGSHADDLARIASFRIL